MKLHTQILVVDVDRRQEIERIIRNRWKVLRASTLKEASELARTHEVFSVILKLDPDRETNLARIRTLREAAPDARFFVAEHDLQLDEIIHAINDFQIDLFLSTPLEPEELLPHLESAHEQFELNRLDFSGFRLGITEHNRKVLCVDDDQRILELYREVFAPTRDQRLEDIRQRRRSTDFPGQAGHATEGALPLEVHTASSSEEAIDRIAESLAEERPFSVGFIDVRMPGGMDGLAAIKKIREADHHILFAIVSAYSDRSLEELQDSFGDDTSWMFLHKPFSEIELKQAGINLVNRWNQRRKSDSLKKFRSKLKYLFYKQHYMYSSANTESLLQTVCNKTVFDVLAADGCTVMFMDRQSNHLRVVSQKGLGENNQELGSAISDWAIQYSRPIILDATTPSPEITAILEQHDIQAVLSVPLEGEHGIIGAISALLSKDSPKFSKEALDVMMLLAEQMETAAQNAQRVQELQWNHELMTGTPFQKF